MPGIKPGMTRRNLRGQRADQRCDFEIVIEPSLFSVTSTPLPRNHAAKSARVSGRLGSSRGASPMAFVDAGLIESARDRFKNILDESPADGIRPLRLPCVKEFVSHGLLAPPPGYGG
jgi:hypothetical protein